jgi:gliding motility-associated-like protein
MFKCVIYTISILSFLGSTFVFSQADECASASQLTNVSNFCSGNAFYTNVNSTASVFPQATCITGVASEDVWFSFTAIGTDILIAASGIGAGGTMNRPRIAIYSGNCATTINQLGCANGVAGIGVTQLYQSALMPGTVYYIRISTLTNNEGTFELCVNNYTPISNPGADCNGASYLCSNNPVSVGILSGGGLNTDEPEASSCMEVPGDDEGNSSWFTFTCATPGPLTFDIIPVNQNDDIDFMVFQLSGTNPCGTRTVVRCNASAFLNPNGAVGLNLTDTDISEMPGFNPGNNSYCQFVNMTVGTSYAILVNNFSTSAGFTLSFGTGSSSGTFLGPNPIITSSSTLICAGQSVTFDALNSTNISANGYNWNFNNGGFPTSAVGVGPHTITYSNAGIYTAILNASNIAGCSDLAFTTINVSAAITPTFNQIAPICSGEPINLPTISTNNISGTWSPNINNTVTTTYTFTPNPSECASITTMTVVVNPAHTISQGLDLENCVNMPIQSLLFTYGGGATGASITGLPSGLTSQTTGSILTISGTPTITGIYPYTVTTSGNNCQTVITSGTITVTNSIAPSFNTLGPFCQNSSPASLPLISTNIPGISGIWTPTTVNTGIIGIQTLTFTPAQNQCASATTIDIEITPLNIPSFLALGPFCINEDVSQITLPQTSIEGIAGSWNPPLISSSIVGSSVYLFTPNISQCTDLGSLSISVINPIIPSFDQLGPYTQAAIPTPLPISSNDSPPITGSWSPNVIQTSLIGQFNYIFTPNISMCAVPVSMDVVIDEEIIFYIPNSFTPDQDEHNQTWGPIFTQGFDPYNFELEIYNRWGELIWLSYDATARWDGTYGTKLKGVQAGIYTYKISYKIKEIDKRVSVTGQVNLIR